MLITIDGKAIKHNINKELADQIPVLNLTCSTTQKLRGQCFQASISTGNTHLSYVTDSQSTVVISTTGCVQPIHTRIDDTHSANAIIHVNRSHISKNSADGGDRPIFTIKVGKTNTYARAVTFMGPIRINYPESRQLSCGARVWIDADPESLVLTDAMSYTEAAQCIGGTV